MTKHQLRITIEQHLLPERVFKYRENIIATIDSSKGTYLASLYHDVAEENNDISPYSEDDFEVSPLVMENGYNAIVIRLPVPEEAIECCYIILCFNPTKDSLSNLHFFTVEKAATNILSEMMREMNMPEISLPEMMLCELTENKRHYNYGSVSSEDEIVQRIEEILMNESLENNAKS